MCSLNLLEHSIMQKLIPGNPSSKSEVTAIKITKPKNRCREINTDLTFPPNVVVNCFVEDELAYFTSEDSVDDQNISFEHDLDKTYTSEDSVEYMSDEGNDEILRSMHTEDPKYLVFWSCLL